MGGGGVCVCVCVCVGLWVRVSRSVPNVPSQSPGTRPGAGGCPYGTRGTSTGCTASLSMAISNAPWRQAITPTRGRPLARQRPGEGDEEREGGHGVAGDAVGEVRAVGGQQRADGVDPPARRNGDVPRPG